MNNLKDIIITGVKNAITVHSPKGRLEKIHKRKYYGLSLCTEGQITYSHKGKSFVSDKNHIIILPQGQNYILNRNKTGVFPLINFTCLDHLTDTFMVFPVDNMDIFLKDFETIKKLILFPENHAKIMSIFYNMIQNLTPETYSNNNISYAVKYIENNFKDPSLTNETLAKECNISEVYLRKLFNEHLNTTPKQYISSIRLQKAKQLLSEGILKINSISEECGFLSSYNFCRFFKDKTGLTPTEYINQNKVFNI